MPTNGMPFGSAFQELKYRKLMNANLATAK
jgi:hypothetical protein